MKAHQERAKQVRQMRILMKVHEDSRHNLIVSAKGWRSRGNLNNMRNCVKSAHRYSRKAQTILRQIRAMERSYE